MVVSKLINFQRKAKPRLKIKILYLVEMFPDNMCTFIFSESGLEGLKISEILV